MSEQLFPKDEKPLEYVGVELQKADAPNQNNRQYSRAELTKAAEVLMPRIARGALRGEFMPSTKGKPEDMMVVHEDRVSHEITKLFMDGDMLKGNIRVLATPYGKMLQGIDSPQFAMRAMARASKSEAGHLEMTDLSIVTFDVVAEKA